MFLSHFIPNVTKYLCLTIVIFAFVSCSKNTEQEIVSEQVQLQEPSAEELEQQRLEEEARLLAERQNTAVENYISTLPYRERLAQLFLVNLQGNYDFEPVEFENGKAVVPGGYLFFSFNIGKSAEEIMHFSDSIASYCKENNIVPPYLSIDQEGGLVNRLRGITSSVPSNRTIAANYSEDEAKSLYSSQAKQLSLLGFSLNLAPVAEVSDSDNSDFLGTRSYGNIEKVKKYTSIAVNAYANTDPHTGLPEIKLSDEELEKNVIEPFSAIISNENPSAILMSHARTAAHDGDKPACFSHYWISDILRDRMKFTGLILSDDIFMAALEKNGYPPDKAVVMAIEAGIDCIMLSEKKFVKVLNVLEKKASEDEAFAHLLEDAVRRVIRYKLGANIFQIAEQENENEEKVLTLSSVEKEDLQERLKSFNEEKTKGDSCVKK